MNLERTILQNLSRISPRMMAVRTLWSEVYLDENRASYAGFRKALADLEEKRQIVVITGEDRDKAKITQEGLARLAE
jgi:hypothetical protein